MSKSTGILVDFISFPVITGFTSAAAIVIAVGQVKVSDSAMFVKYQMYFGNYEMPFLKKVETRNLA